ncbi:uncharacterized protein [Anabrus simplex]|uniref:uncharacterized protein n=1 Tax=Anabrus simplex TaxID=316456 RepID=UPI0035A351A6
MAQQPSKRPLLITKTCRLRGVVWSARRILSAVILGFPDQGDVYSLNRMHIMDEDCSNKPSALDDSPKTNGSPKTVAADGEKEKDSDSGKENSGTASSKCEQDSTSKKRGASQEGSEKVDEEKESAADNEEDKTDESAELQIPVPVAASTPMTVKEGEAEKDNTNVESPSASGGEEGKQVVDNGARGDEAARQQEKQDQQQDYLKGGGAGDNCNLPPSPPEEEEDNSGASSPASQREEPKRCPERRKRDSSESDSDTPSVVKKMKMTHAELEERERTVSEYVESAAGTSLEEIQRHTEKLQQEIHTLNALARAKEQEWNNILRVRKIKEEMYIRLQRKKQVMLLMMGAAGKGGDALDWDLMSDIRFGDFFGSEELPYDKNKVCAMNCKRVSKASSNKFNMKGHLHQQPSSTGSVLKGVRNHLPVTMVPAIPSGPCNLSTTSPVSSSSSSHLSANTTLTRVPESSRDKLNGRTHRPILPKPTIIVPSGNGSNSNNSNNGQNPVIGEGRQGPILDVRSIIADYRSKHPGDVPRRGRRLKSALSPTPSCQVPENLVTSTRVSGTGGILSMASLALGSGSQMRPGPGLIGSSTTDMPDLGFLLNSAADSARQDSSRPSSADSSRSGAPSQVAHESGNHGAVGGISFKDVLVQFAKLSQNEQRHEPVPTTTAANKAPPYPEVTLHPVLAPNSPPSSSLLHGILTKSTSMQQQRGGDTNNARPTTFSPTLARLLTAPERMSGSIANTTTVTPFHGTAGPVSISDLLSTSKQTRNEITITPVAAQQPVKAKEEVVLLEEQEDSADRLVIDESGEGGPRIDAEDDQSGAQDISADDVPECQGCHQRAAQFVCAGCGNQWYCSRDCQVSAWDDHSEVCSG